MLPKRHKLSRTAFPTHKDPRSSWSGVALRIQAYLPASARADRAGESGLGMAGKTNEKDRLPRFALIITKRLSDNAVMRNTFKRRVMEALEQNMWHFKALPYQKYIVFPTKHLNMITTSDIVKDIEEFSQKR